MKKLIFGLITAVFIGCIVTKAYATEVRRPSGNGTVTFQAGETVMGSLIELDKGNTYRNCKLFNAPSTGRVTDGTVWPWEEEMANLPECKNPEPTITDPRVATGANHTLPFAQGTPVVGSLIKWPNGKTYTNCYFPTAPYSGTVTSGVLYPWIDEVSSVQTCYSQDYYNNENRNQPSITIAPTPTPEVRTGRPSSPPTPTPEQCTTAQSVASLTHTEAKYWSYIEDQHGGVPVNWIFYRAEGAVDVFAPLSGGTLHNYYTFQEDGPQGIKPGTTIHTDRASLAGYSRCRVIVR